MPRGAGRVNSANRARQRKSDLDSGRWRLGRRRDERRSDGAGRRRPVECQEQTQAGSCRGGAAPSLRALRQFSRGA